MASDVEQRSIDTIRTLSMDSVQQANAGHPGTAMALAPLAYLYDDNHITIDGTTAISFTEEDRGARLAAQGWHVQHIDDANDLDGLREAIAAARAETERPSLVVIRSHIAFGAPRAVDTAK